MVVVEVMIVEGHNMFLNYYHKLNTRQYMSHIASLQDSRLKLHFDTKNFHCNKLVRDLPHNSHCYIYKMEMLGRNLKCIDSYPWHNMLPYNRSMICYYNLKNLHIPLHHQNFCTPHMDCMFYLRSFELRSLPAPLHQS